MSELTVLADLPVLALIDWGKRALEQAGSFDDVRNIKAQAEAIAAYQRSIGAAQEAVDAAVEIKLRAERRMGQELQAGQERGEIATQERKPSTVPDGNGAPATHADLGLTRKEAAGYKTLAKPTAEQFESVIESARGTGQLSGAKVQHLAREAARNNWSPDDIKTAAKDAARTQYRREIEAEPNAKGITAQGLGYESNEDFQQTADLLGQLEDLRAVLPATPEDAARAAGARARQDLLALIRPVVGFLSTLEDLLVSMDRPDAA